MYHANGKIIHEWQKSGGTAAKEFQFKGDDVLIQKVGDAVILVPHEKSWEVFIHGLNNFSEDFMKDGRRQGAGQKRNSL